MPQHPHPMPSRFPFIPYIVIVSFLTGFTNYLLMGFVILVCVTCDLFWIVPLPFTMITQWFSLPLLTFKVFVFRKKERIVVLEFKAF